jgi:hypothetical protein
MGQEQGQEQNQVRVVVTTQWKESVRDDQTKRLANLRSR